MLRAKREDVEWVAVTGDLTDGGRDGIVTCTCLAPFIGGNNWFVGGGQDNQLGKLINDFVTPLVNAGKPTYLIQGNHDTYNGAHRYPVADYVRRRHGELYYIVERGGVIFAFLDVYPTGNIRSWLWGELNRRRATEKRTPIVFFTHYNLCDAYSDWWPNDDKEAFYSLFKDANVLGIFVGHNHTSYTYTWKTWPVFSTAGFQYAVADIDPLSGRLTVTFEPKPTVSS